MRIKVIVRNGVVESALSDKEEDVELEVVDIGDDYEDCDALCAYADSLYNSPEFREIGCTVARFTDEEASAKIGDVAPLSETASYVRNDLRAPGFIDNKGGLYKTISDEAIRQVAEEARRAAVPCEGYEPVARVKPITNADRLNDMTTEEKARFLCKLHRYKEYGQNENADKMCEQLWLNWLKKEAQNDL